MIRLLAVLIFLPSLLFAQLNSSSKRIIKPCLAIDGEYPVPISLVNQAMDKVSSEFENNVGIVFEKTAPVLHDGNLERNDFDHLIYLISICPLRFEMAILFTNRLLEKVYDGDTTTLAGDSSERYGIVIVYGFWDRFQFQDAGGESVMITVLKHELGHLFGLPHQTTDESSFMYTPSHRSRGLWTPEIIKILLKNKNRKWLP